MNGRFYQRSFSILLLHRLTPSKAEVVMAEVHEGICREHIRRARCRKSVKSHLIFILSSLSLPYLLLCRKLYCKHRIRYRTANNPHASSVSEPPAPQQPIPVGCRPSEEPPVSLRLQSE
ncbi:hypothetical protein B296_00005940 [Ensete ventricosum]|uniref:Uncharacterized protein n=1 Tax=Ensete ventricosum TaxID=4639 RepID=A0A427AFL2_ENSVE|nr:hypothetical protein B296_00005940 [Ensete ventricosum]